MTVELSCVQVAALSSQIESVFLDVAGVDIGDTSERAKVYRDQSLSHLHPLLGAYERLVGVLPILAV